jgi:zinc finger protein
MSEEPEQTSSEIAQGMNYQDWNGVDIMPSLCMNCNATGETRMMLHKIPYFRELIIASFFCEECGERNNEVTFGGEIQLQGCLYELKVTSEKDLDRQLIKSDSASVRIPELDFEIPAMTQRGAISTIEGMLKKAAENLALYQEQRMEQMPEVGIRVAQIIGQLTMMANRFPSAFPFHIVIDDPAGNSFVENPNAPTADPNLHVKYYSRTAEQDAALGLAPESGTYKDDKESNFTALMGKDGGGFGQLKATPVEDGEAAVTSRTAGDVSEADLDSGVVVIPTPCPHCFRDGESRTALTSIPHFKEVLIMAFTCKECGFRTNEVKGGGGVPTYGSEVVLTVQGPEDLSRDLLKSDTAMVGIPELELELDHGTLGKDDTPVFAHRGSCAGAWSVLFASRAESQCWVFPFCAWSHT